MDKRRPFSSTAAVILTVLSVAPFAYVFAKSLISNQGGFTLAYYYQVFLAQEQYLLRFWKSLGLCLCITAGQVTVSTLAGYGFAKCSFPGKKILFFLLMVLMIMPLQVTLVPNFIILDGLKLLNTYAELDAQGISGSNISQSKREIEATMDTLCDAFAAQLDKLFTSDAMDVSADIAAMQAMLAQDGLTDSDFNLPV